MFTRGIYGVILAGGIGLSSVGCTMCAQTPEDYTYAAYGGIVQRADRVHGRVGSAFSPAEGAPVHAGPYDASLDAPALLTPGYSGEPPTSAQSQATTAAFDPGDILSSEGN